jgi:hypothetical protein
MRGVAARSVPDFLPICSGFIFCEFFSNLGRTGCRRGRTPERPLRQPSKVWLTSQTVFVSGASRADSTLPSPLSATWVNPLSWRLAHVATCAERREPGFT